MVAPETDVERVRRFCSKENNHEHVAELRVDFELDNNTITLFEDRPRWDGPPTERMREDFARMRWSPSNGNWTLFCLDRNLKWHKYPEIGPGSMQRLLKEIDEDPICIFKG